MTCTNKTLKGKKHKHCATTLLKHALTISASVKSAKATLRRAGKVYATGTLTRRHGPLRLALHLNHRKRLPSGAYTLTLRWKAGKSTHTSPRHITLA